MRLIAYSRSIGLGLVLWPLIAASPPDAGAQTPAVVASHVTMGGDAAAIRVELADAGSLEIALRNGRVLIDGDEVGSYRSGDALDRSWRGLLDSAMDASPGTLPALFAGWSPPAGEAGERITAALARAGLTGTASPADPADQDADPGAAQEPPDLDAALARIAELERRLSESQDRVADLERRLQAAERDARAAARTDRRRADGLFAPFRYVARGLSGIMSVLATYLVLVGIGFGVVYFGRPYLEGMADTARRATLRSFLVGLAGSFLVLPAFVGGIIALAISIVGVLLIPFWALLFPAAVFAAIVVGYLAVAHGAGEALAERPGSRDKAWGRPNSYAYVLSGVAILLALFLGAHVLQMTGPLLGFLHGLLMFFGILITWGAATVGLGAVLLSRAGTRPLTPGGEVHTDEPFEATSHV